ncbi:MAG: hypothetical protein HY301_06870 [Verrucomicrobia bacterium]|nr:hypothetical protein [Verrucomicrobiota bacterium]
MKTGRLPALLAFLLGATVASAAETAAPAGAMWVYETKALLTNAAERAQLVAFSRERRITEIFLQMHYARGSDERGKYSSTVPAADTPALRALLGEAHRAGLHVHALSGDPSYALRDKHDRPLAHVDAVLEFNAAASAGERFDGIHFDIEPHGLPAWKTSTDAERTAILQQFVEVNARAAARLRGNPYVVFGVDLPFWFDKPADDGSTRWPVTLNGRTQDATKHLGDLADNVVLMSYRNTAEGKNGLVALTERTVKDTAARRAKVFVGVKMADIGPRMETFFGRTAKEMETETAKVTNAFGSERGFGGIAYFHYKAFREMVAGKTSPAVPKSGEGKP